MKPATTSGQSVLLQGEDRRELKNMVLELSSRDRNFSLEPKAAKYRYKFPYAVRDVERIRLIGGTVPAAYNITTPYNSLIMYDSSTSTAYTVTIPPGIYSDGQLSYALQNQLDALYGTATWSCVNDPSTGKMTIVRTDGVTANFTFRFKNSQFSDVNDASNGSLVSVGCLARFLGFRTDDYTSVNDPANYSAPTLVSQYAMDTLTVTSRFYLYINADSKHDISAINRGNGRRSPFAIIYPDYIGSPLTPGSVTESSLYCKYLNKDIYQPVFVSLPKPMSRIFSLDVEFRDEFGNLIDFGGRDNTLLLEITYYE